MTITVTDCGGGGNGADNNAVNGDVRLADGADELVDALRCS